MSFGVYIHFPYCRKKCPYCDFAVAVRRSIPHERYAEAVIAELRARAPRYADRTLVSIYFGGGTPGLWRPDCVAEVLRAVRARFASTAVPEITLEANPDALERDHLTALHAAGVNRLSLGVQSLAPRHLVTLGRLHGPEEPRQAVADARAAGFTNLSLDLMFGLPGQRREELEADLAGLVALAPEHLSTYGLTVEERTPFGFYQRTGRLTLPEIEEQAAMYERIGAALAQAGYVHYEVSSHARPGFAAVHNSLYWSGGEWLGLGCSAHSFRRLPAAEGGGGERFATVRSVDAYLGAMARLEPGDFPDALVATHERIGIEELGREAMWLGLRRLDVGVERAAYAARYGVDPLARFAAEIARLEREGLVVVDERRLVLSRRGVLLADEVAARFV